MVHTLFLWWLGAVALLLALLVADAIHRQWKKHSRPAVITIHVGTNEGGGPSPSPEALQFWEEAYAQRLERRNRRAQAAQHRADASYAAYLTELAALNDLIETQQREGGQ